MDIFPLPLFERIPPHPSSLGPKPKLLCGKGGGIKRAALRDSRVSSVNSAIDALNWCASPNKRFLAGGIVSGGQRSALRHVWDCVKRAGPPPTGLAEY